MPCQFKPRKSSAHRTACFALYRALLEQCPRIPLPNDLPSRGPISPIKYLVRKAFKRHASAQGERLVVKALKVGYSAEELLRNAGDGNPAAISKIHNLLRLEYTRYSTARTLNPYLPPPRTQPPCVAPFPGAAKTLHVRPLPREKLSGPRCVPVLTQANGFPMLRFKKPQSPFLSRVLRDKVNQKDKRFLALQRVERYIEVAKNEEEWEKIVVEQLVEEGGSEWLKGEGRTWGRAPWDRDLWAVRAGIFKGLVEGAKRNLAMGERMAEIVEAEKELWEKERGERRHKKKLAKKALKAKAQEEGSGENKS